MTAYYNENDPKAAAWLRELIREGHIAAGEVDERSIEDVLPNDLRGFKQCHFFAGIGGWSYALRLAGWPDDKPVWTGSCPCQPFSAAGKGAGFADERHLWPSLLWLVQQCRPYTVFGEQVANALPWIDIVQGDLEAQDYSFGYAVLGAHSVGAPHIRQRLYWVADASGQRQQQHSERDSESLAGAETPCWDDTDGRSVDGELANTSSQQQHRGRDSGRRRRELADDRELGDSDERPQGRVECGDRGNERLTRETSVGRKLEHAKSNGWKQRRPESSERSAIGGCWQSAEFIPCTDGKARPVEPGTFPLAHGVPHRVGLLRGYGNAIVPQVAAAFIEAYTECQVDV